MFKLLPLRDQTRFAIHYAALFSGVGIVLPHFPRWLNGQGLTPQEVANILAAAFIGKVLIGPLFSSFADQTGSRKIWLLILASGYMVAVFSLQLSPAYYFLLLVWGVGGAMATTQIPISDSLSVLAVKRGGLNYGPARLWGSLSFILVSIGAGIYLVGKPLDHILWLLTGFSILAAIAVLVLPNHKTERSGRGVSSLLDAFRIKEFRIFILIAGMIQASHAALYVFGSIHWEKAGLTEWQISLLWAEGVIIEILVFAFGRRLLLKLGVLGLLSLSVIGGLIRWTVLGMTTDLVYLGAVQTLHAFTFATTHLAIVSYIGQKIPDRLSASAQGLYDLLANGIIFGVGMWLAGLAYGSLNGHTFWIMAGFVAFSGTMLFVHRDRYRL